MQGRRAVTVSDGVTWLIDVDAVRMGGDIGPSHIPQETACSYSDWRREGRAGPIREFFALDMG